MPEASKGGNNAGNMYLSNRIIILQYLQRHGVCTRAQIAKKIGLTEAAISKITAAMIENGIIEECGVLAGSKGRRSIGIHINPNGVKIVGVKLSRRNFAVGVFDFSGECVASTQENFTREDDLRQVFHRIRSAIRKYIANYPDIVVTGMAVPGPFLKKEDRILMITEMGDTGEDDIDLRAEFNVQRVGNRPIIFEQDANAGALADWWFEIGDVHLRGTAVHFLVGEGVGAGVISNGALNTGDQGTAAEIGHTSIDINGEKCHCGNRGCLEQYCSSIAFVKNAMAHRAEAPESRLNAYDKLTSSIIFREAQAGDAKAIELVRREGTYIGYGLVNLVHCYNPSTILISNEISKGGPLLLDAALAVARERLIPRLFESVQIRLSTFEGDDILYGAAAVAIDYCLNRPDIMGNKRTPKQTADKEVTL